MKILYIHQYFCTRQGRSGTRSYEFAKDLVRRGHAVTMLTSASELSDVKVPPGRRQCTSLIDGITVIALAVPYSQNMGVVGRVWSFLRFMVASTLVALRQPAPDVIIATSTPLTVGVPALLASWRHRRPMVFEVRDLWPEAPIQFGVIRNRVLIAALRWFEMRVYRASARIIALSPGIRDGILSTGIPAERVAMIPNCSDLDLFVPEAPDPAIVARYGLQGAFVVTHAGSMGDTNGLETLIDAADLLQRRGKAGIKILLVGEGRCGNSLRAQAASKRLTNVVFTGGMPRTGVAQVLKASDVCLYSVKNVPILETCSPNKLFDALAAGRAVIVNSNGWTREIVEGHGVGRFAQPDSASSLAEQILWLRDNTEARLEMGRRARGLAEMEFDRRKLAADFERVLLRAAGRGEEAAPADLPVGRSRLPVPDPVVACEGEDDSDRQVGATSRLEG